MIAQYESLRVVTWFSRSFWDSQTQDAPSLFFPGLLCLLATPAIRGDPIGRMTSNSSVGILILWCSYTGCSDCDTKNWCIFLRSTDLRIKYHCKSWFQTVHRLKPNHETWTWINLQSATSVKPFLTWDSLHLKAVQYKIIKYKKSDSGGLACCLTNVHQPTEYSEPEMPF